MYFCTLRRCARLKIKGVGFTFSFDFMLDAEINLKASFFAFSSNKNNYHNAKYNSHIYFSKCCWKRMHFCCMCGTLILFSEDENGRLQLAETQNYTLLKLYFLTDTRHVTSHFFFTYKIANSNRIERSLTNTWILAQNWYPTSKRDFPFFFFKYIFLN